jgi:hypothetical protein
VPILRERRKSDGYGIESENENLNQSRVHPPSPVRSAIEKGVQVAKAETSVAIVELDIGDLTPLAEIE